MDLRELDVVLAQVEGPVDTSLLPWHHTGVPGRSVRHRLCNAVINHWADAVTPSGTGWPLITANSCQYRS